MSRLLIICCLLLSLSLLHADTLDQGLAAMGTTRERFGVDQGVVRTRINAQYRLPLYDEWYAHPLRIPFYERHLREQLLAAKGRLHPLCVTAAGMMSVATWRDMNSPTPEERYRQQAAQPGALKTAIHALDPKARVPAFTSVPPRVQQMTAELLFVMADALHWRELMLRDIPARDRPFLYAMLTDPELDGAPPPSAKAAKLAKPVSRSLDGVDEHLREMDLLARLDLPLPYAATDDLTAVIDAVSADLQKTPVTETFHFTCHTRWGEIRLSGGTDDVYPAGPHYLLILDTSGNDRYEAGGATGGAAYPLGIIIDAAGDDTYEAATEAPCFGAGILGWGIVVDLAGNDHYRTKGSFSQGCGKAGVGLLCDLGGDDTYQAQGSAQGYGYFGLGLLVDAAGNDTYDMYQQGQGCGGTMGCGLLIDLAGDDHYTANDTNIICPSAQTAQHNTSLCQGVGVGERRDGVDAHSLAGGIGLLLDAAGNDTYFGGVFCQAAGYWAGVGILDDSSGNNTFRGVWYTQSATAHFAVSYLRAGDGNSTFTSTNAMAVAAAHDFSVSLFVKEGGDDIYEGACTLGQALNNSAALFLDTGGNNTYRAGKFGLSAIQTTIGIRPEVPSWSLFLDLGGKDTYPPGATAGNNRTWTQDSAHPALHGAGMDVEGGTVEW